MVATGPKPDVSLSVPLSPGFYGFCSAKDSPEWAPRARGPVADREAKVSLGFGDVEF